jgi:hypothetical protein
MTPAEVVLQFTLSVAMLVGIALVVWLAIIVRSLARTVRRMAEQPCGEALPSACGLHPDACIKTGPHVEHEGTTGVQWLGPG